MKFEQGIWYEFSILGIIDIPEEGVHYILLHETGRKMLLKQKYYVKYNFSIGQIIQCRVDKVNCTGKVFLEPKHPYYSDNQAYLFEIVKLIDDRDSLFNAKIKDAFENIIDIYLESIETKKLNSYVLLNVDKIKKGVPILGALRSGKIEEINRGKEETITMQIVTIENFNSDQYFILLNKSNLWAKLKVKHYIKWGFDINDEILCRIIGRKHTTQLDIEPINPWYQIGKVYPFKKVGVENYIDLEGNPAKVMVVTDVISNKCGVKITDLIEKKLQVVDDILCRVNGFRKGRPQLEIDLK
jgi:hypothetical protein